jgi:glyoxylase I family protein
MLAQGLEFTVTGIDHIVLRVRELARAVHFYRDVLGCAIEREQPELGLVQLRAGHSLIDLVSADGPLGRRLEPDEDAGNGDEEPGAFPGGGPNLEHFCLSIRPFDEPVLYAHLASFGVAAGEPGERYGAEGEGRSFYIEDPDGNRIELKGAR